MHTQEDRLESIERQIANPTLEGDQLCQQVADLLGRLTYDADVQAPADPPTKRGKQSSEEENRP